MKPANFPHFAALLLVFIIFNPVSAQQQPCTQPLTLPAATEPNIFSDEQEIYLGDAVAERIQRQYRVIEDPEVTEYLTKIGERLTKHLPINKLRFQFFLVDLPDANAFVLPGGRIFVSRKLVAAAQTEDELAGVIAHELGHLVVHQGAIDTTRQFKEALGVTSVTDRNDIFEKYNRLIDNFRQKPGAFKVGDRERGQLFADQAGMFAFVAAGYEPEAIPRFWDRITETQGKKGNWLTDVFGTTRPEQKRLREMVNATKSLPAQCRQKSAATQSEAFAQWQSRVVAYNGLGRKESLHGVLAKQQLSPPLRSDIIHLRFSPDGAYLLAQDDAGINVLSREPFAPLFRIDTEFDTYYANFTPDSKEIIFYSDNLRVERWSVAEAQRIDVKEVVLLKGCLETELSPDGKLLACLDPEFNLNLLRVDSGETVWSKKEFYTPNYWEAIRIYTQLRLRRDDSSDLNMAITHMRFSPDGRYFVAGHHIPRGFQNRVSGEFTEVIDTNTFTKVSVPDFVKKLIAGGFTFVGNDRIAGINYETFKKSAVVKFPSGEVVSELELWRKGMSGPTRGDYLLIRPVKDFAVGVMDINSKAITKANERAALDIYEPYFVAEMRNGQVGLYKLEKNELVATAVLSNVSLGRLRVAEVSPELKWLALSGRSRGGVWNLNKGEAALSLRNFQGGYVSDDDYFFAEFPKTEDVERNVARFNLKNGEAVAGPKIEGDTSHQYGQYLFTIKSAKEAEKPAEADGKTAKLNPADYRKNVVIEMFDARTMKSLWKQNFPKEAPRAWIAPNNQTMALLWALNTDAAKSEISADPKLTQRLVKMKEKEGDYFLKIVDAQSGNEIGKLLIETGKGSFRVSNIFAAGDSVIVTDTQNRVLVYSLKTGEQKGRVFGAYATVSQASKLLCVENESGKLAVYDLETMEKRDDFIFTRPISMLRFSQDGKRLFVLTVAQTVYIL
ncbi:MAG TPA: M48 family metalloprotease, partial [Pyrinomonadaceae bacterium]|nr:M48 family metalloprotease [Pyrinomonadaceae bacterium]